MIIEQGWEKPRPLVDVKEREYSRDEGDFRKKLGEAYYAYVFANGIVSVKCSDNRTI